MILVELCRAFSKLPSGRAQNDKALLMARTTFSIFVSLWAMLGKILILNIKMTLEIMGNTCDCKATHRWVKILIIKQTPKAKEL